MSAGIACAVEVIVLSLKRCRELLGPNCQLSDEELSTLRDHLHAAANVALDGYSSLDEDLTESSVVQADSKAN